MKNSCVLLWLVIFFNAALGQNAKVEMSVNRAGDSAVYVKATASAATLDNARTLALDAALKEAIKYANTNYVIDVESAIELLFKENDDLRIHINVSKREKEYVAVVVCALKRDIKLFSRR